LYFCDNWPLKNPSRDFFQIFAFDGQKTKTKIIDLFII
jgi:hypothetical protein